jgi:hypothetical protein
MPENISALPLPRPANAEESPANVGLYVSGTALLSWVERVTKAFGGYRREKPRDPVEARLLRERGTPEHLIGPEKKL